MKLAAPSQLVGSHPRGSRRFRVVVAGLAAAAVTLAGCAGTGGSSNDDTVESSLGDIPTDTSGAIRVLMEEVPDADIVEELVADFNSEYPDIKVDIEKLSYDQMRDKLVASFRAPEPAYDLIIVDNPWMQDFAGAGFLQPIDKRIANTSDYEADDFFSPLSEINEADGKTYAVPFYNYALGLIYRSDLYEKTGTEPPADLDQLLASAKKLNSGDMAGIAMQPQRGYKIFEEWGNWLFAAGGEIYDSSGAPSLNTAEAKVALESYIAAYENSAPKNSLSWGFDEANRSVAAGKSAQMISYNWSLPSLNDTDGAAGDLAGKFALAPMPGGKQVLGSWNWAIPSNSADGDAAWAFISHITSKSVDVERVKRGGAAIRQSTLSDDEVLADGGFGKEYYEAVEKILSNAEPLCTGLNCDEMIQAVGTELNAAVAGKKSVEDALNDANEAAKKIQKN